MIFFERIRTSVTIAMKLKDEYTPGQQVIGDISLKVPGIRKSQVKYNAGYFLLLDVPGGKYSIIAEGKFYKKRTFLRSFQKSSLFTRGTAD